MMYRIAPIQLFLYPESDILQIVLPSIVDSATLQQ
jgi:hypothetical protein